VLGFFVQIFSKRIFIPRIFDRLPASAVGISVRSGGDTPGPQAEVVLEASG